MFTPSGGGGTSSPSPSVFDIVNPDRTCANPRERRSSCPAMSPSGTSARTPSAPSSLDKRSPQESNEVPIPFVRWSGSTKMNRSSVAPEIGGGEGPDPLQGLARRTGRQTERRVDGVGQLDDRVEVRVGRRACS